MAITPTPTRPTLPTSPTGLMVTIGSSTYQVTPAQQTIEFPHIICQGPLSSTDPSAVSGSGVLGLSTTFDAIVGETQSDAHAGITGRNLTTGANGGVGVYGVGGQYAGKFDGKIQVNGDADVTGTLTVGTDISMPASDFAEDFPIEASEDVEPGTVMVLDENGLLRPSDNSYDRKVVGVVSGAGDYRPGLILDRQKSSEGRLPLALVGKVYCKVDASYGPIEVGDLLTTSPRAGHAMKASDPARAFGAVIGKALRPLKLGQALVPILVALQ
jgi:hypothetical protein